MTVNHAHPEALPEALVVDLDESMGPFAATILLHALPYAAARIAPVFGMTRGEVVEVLARVMLKYDHEHPLLLELSPLRQRFGGSARQFVSEVVAPFWDAWDQAVREFYRPFPGVIETLSALKEMGVKLACVSDAHDVCAVMRLEAGGLLPYFSAVVAIETPVGGHESLPRWRHESLPSVAFRS